MNTITRKHLILGLLMLAVSAASSSQTSPAAMPPDLAGDALKVARLDPAGKLLKPADLESWIFVGASLGMGYNPGSFNAAHPGQFQVVLMEPNAFRFFKANQRYAPGSMFLLSFYDSDQRRSINQKGFVQAQMTNYEIHLIEPKTGDDRHTFYMFGATDTRGSPLPRGNGCVRCHVDHGAFDGTFAQFYPTIRPLIPAEALKAASRLDDIR
jgi:hypothetical protein